ncbi:MAG TPA: hypothetical protein VEQ40_06710 [Pyrinomonadaceae bacterium]|nr:hypothetical protein [Pyrinomonadaceae bacterium]
MKKILIPVLFALLLGACSDKHGENSNQSHNSRAESSATSTPEKPQVGDTVIYHSSSGQRFYAAKVTSIEGTRAKLQDRDETVERELAELYAVPKAGNKPTVQPGDIVAARYGQTSVWEAAEVITAGDKVTIKWLSSSGDRTSEVSPESILTLSPAVAAKVKNSFSTKK